MKQDCQPRKIIFIIIYYDSSIQYIGGLSPHRSRRLLRQLTDCLYVTWVLKGWGAYTNQILCWFINEILKSDKKHYQCQTKMNKISFNMLNNKPHNSLGTAKRDNEIECTLNNAIYLQIIFTFAKSIKKFS